MSGPRRRVAALCLLGATVLSSCTFYRTREGFSRMNEPGELKSIDPSYEAREDYKWTTWAFLFAILADVLTLPVSAPYDLGHLLWTGKFPDPRAPLFPETTDDFEPM